MLSRANIPNILSLSRVPLGIGFLLTFSVVDPKLFWVSMIVASIALATDIADGKLARRWKVDSKLGYFLDGIGDKCFTVSICLVFANSYPELTLLAWALIFREIVLYALRSIDNDLSSNLQQLRVFTLIQAGSIRLLFLAFFVGSALVVHGMQPPIWYLWVYISFGGLSVISGWTSVVKLTQKLMVAEIDKPLTLLDQDEGQK